MQYTLSELRNKLFSEVFRVYDVFKNHFGQQFVDLQRVPSEEQLKQVLLASHPSCKVSDDEVDIDGDILYELKNHYGGTLDKYAILVWWPSVTVTNEYNEHISIQDLYAMVEITLNGNIPYENRGFLLNRATYPEVQFRSRYMHSHVPRLDYTASSTFEAPCLGNGPIKNTINTLKCENNEDIIWMLFCEELSRYVTVESITGGPYIKLSSVGTTTNIADSDYNFSLGNLQFFVAYLYSSYNNSPYFLKVEELRKRLDKFITYYLQNGHFTVGFRNNHFVPGMSYYDYILDVSNSFIEYYNQFLKEDKKKLNYLYLGFLRKVTIIDGKIYEQQSGDSVSLFSIDSYQGDYVCTFKGKETKRKIIPAKPAEHNYTTLIHKRVAMYIIAKILTIINFRYYNEHICTNRKDLASAYKGVFYI